MAAATMQGMDFALAQIADRVRAAAADQTPLRIRGGGTKDFHGLALHGEVLDTRALRGILSYEPSESGDEAPRVLAEVKVMDRS